MDITSNTYLKLMVAEKADQSEVDALGERMDAAELKITPDPLFLRSPAPSSIRKIWLLYLCRAAASK